MNLFQILLALRSEELVNRVGTSKDDNMNIINPISLKITIQKCLISDDPRFPSMKYDNLNNFEFEFV